MWKKGTYKDYYYIVKIYEQPSHFGIYNGKISKLSICKGDTWNTAEEIYNYDRGLDFDNTPPGLLDEILEYLGN